eukprot:CAMPEP_0194515318 /NCGR_PEP_ID=MMETSP0253-20130528/47968_1 /TAXON_ID=2966 /ORGANISM="Noctiluca scintillans" /LENGTH=112 /DNA_ID=CAMNT_0039359061 /DNA_START=21 /DNA_END=355 /DNA_ORIENTATION=-
MSGITRVQAVAGALVVVVAVFLLLVVAVSFLGAAHAKITCVDAPLNVAWSSGGVWTCDTYHDLYDTAYCVHEEISVKCCHCGGGMDEETLELSTASSTDAVHRSALTAAKFT